MSTTDILYNSHALHSLKRNQLISLCKSHGIKVVGKNEELVRKLEAWAAEHPPSARNNASTPVLNLPSSDDSSPVEKEDSGRAKMRPSDVWEIIEEETIQQMKELESKHSKGMGSMTSKSSLSNKGSLRQRPNEFGGSLASSGSNSTLGSTLSKSSSLSSSIRSLATSLKWSASGGTGSSKTSFVPTASSRYSSRSKIFAAGSQIPPVPPMPAHLSVGSETLMEVDPEPEPTEGIHIDDPSAGDISVDLSLQQTIRLVKPPAASTTLPPQPATPVLRAFRTSFPLAPLTPLGAPGRTTTSLYPPLPSGNLFTPARSSPLKQQAHSAANSVGAEPSTPPPTPPVRHMTPVGVMSPTPPPATTQPFIFGSPAPAVSNAEFGAAASSVLSEMNRRLAQSGVATLSSDIISGLEGDPAKAQETLDRLKNSGEGGGVLGRPTKPVPKRFSGAHKKEFGKMESIVDYAARRNLAPSVAPQLGRPNAGKKRKSSVMAPPAASPGKRAMPGGFGGDDEDEEEEDEDRIDDRRKSKRVRVSSFNQPEASGSGVAKVTIATPERADEEEKNRDREAIKRKLELSRARRRSSRGRPSVGGGARASIGRAPPAKKTVYSRFGFLKGAVGAVKSAWNRGAPAPAATKTTKPPPTAAPVTTRKVSESKPPVQAPQPTGRKVSGNSTAGLNPTLPRPNSRTSTRAAIPSFPRNSSTHKQSESVTRASQNSNTRTSTSSRPAGKVNSIGVRKPSLASLSGTVEGSMRRSSRSSTLMAPTASSLARMHSAAAARGANENDTTGVRAPGRVGGPRPLPVPAMAKVDESEVLGDIRNVDLTTSVEPSTEPLSLRKQSGLGPTPTSSLSRKPTLNSTARRPRISRTTIVTKLHARRLASDSSRRSSSSKRKSMAAGGVKAAAGISRHSGMGAGGGAGSMTMKKRIRASEVARRKSRAGSGVLMPMSRMEMEEEGDSDGAMAVDDSY